MTQFEKSMWADSGFSQNYRNEADIYLPFRNQFIEVTKSFYSYFISSRIEPRILDLGCGDGRFIEELYKTFSPINVTLVDGSDEMLKAAKKRLAGKTNLEFIKASFQTLLKKEFLTQQFDFIHSSLAIHHLKFEEKKQLYAYIYELLSSGGCFVHYDVVAAPSEKVEKFYLSLWREWILKYPDKDASKGMEVIPEKYKENPDDMPDTLESQMEALKEAGFKNVDCYCKYGIFSLFGGFK